MAKEANDKDVEHWKNEADKKVNMDLDKWQSIVESGKYKFLIYLIARLKLPSSGDHDQIHSQLENLQSQILSASNNMKLLVPVLGKMIDTMHYLGKDSGNFIKGMSLTGLVKMIHGKRDNKVSFLRLIEEYIISLDPPPPTTPSLRPRESQHMSLESLSLKIFPS